MKSVSNALRVLLLLSDKESLRLSEVSEALGMSTPAAHRLLVTLKAYSFVQQGRPHGPYSLGSALPDIVRRSHPERLLLEAAHGELRKLAELTDETANLLSFRGTDVVFVDGVEGTQPLRVSTRIGDRVPAYATAAGKVMMSELETDAIWELYPHGLQTLTDHTLTSVLELTGELRAIRESGFAVNVNESLDGVVAIGVPIRQSVTNVQAAVTVSLPTQRYDESRIDAILDALRNTAQCVADEMSRLSGART